MYDIIIIGAGTAGQAAYKEAIKHTSNILIVNHGPWDTTCARVGCMPSKVLISVANQLHDAQSLNKVGITTHLNLDSKKIMLHVQKLRNQFTQAALKDVARWDSAHKISGQAHFIDAATIEINQKHYQARSFILAVGSTPSFDLEWKKELGSKLITSDEIFELEQLPKSIAVIGSGVIAIEIAQALQRLGVKTTIFARSRKVGTLTSPLLQKMAQELLSQEIDIKFEVLPTQVRNSKDGVQVVYQEHGQEHNLVADYLLVATGRRTLLNTLRLENIDAQFIDLKNLPVHPETKQLAHYPIFIIGDAHTNTPIQHEAAHEGHRAILNCLNLKQIKNIRNLTPIGIVFCEPEMAIVGQSFKQLESNKIPFVTGYVSYAQQGRAQVLGKNYGALEVYIHTESRKILGAELLMTSAEHLAHLLCWMIAEDLTLDHLLAKPFYHPTLEEGLRTALKHARRQLNTIQ
ncbi:dihydrolipoyl dehydrogenase [Acinetobacter sp. ANC 4910]|uniref:dihydrolipoyl dehydrogenase n=1 Tax=Acinetobacter sp. ANC 4910 TaxID=2529850 RepID=UPI00103EDACE|nr:dihydrolipoyl dehydrogenase [Acinetobacter sp. ANC 4910]TCB34149.1 dihydrolipoyl dehydrogenase [Acinetobacter sp. ANC 4910]